MHAGLPLPELPIAKTAEVLSMVSSPQHAELSSLIIINSTSTVSQPVTTCCSSGTGQLLVALHYHEPARQTCNHHQPQQHVMYH
jgi:hypothetical protein